MRIPIFKFSLNPFSLPITLIVAGLLAIAPLGAHSQHAAKKWYDKGKEAEDNQSYEEAISAYGRASESYLAKENCERYLHCENIIGDLLTVLGRYQESYDRMMNSFETCGGALDTLDPEIAIHHTIRGLSLDYMGKQAEALAQYTRALSLRKSWPEPDSTAIAKSLINIGVIHMQKAELEEASRHFKTAIAYLEKPAPPYDKALAMAYNNLGIIHYYEGNISRAIKPFEKALDIQISILGPDHQLVGSIYGNLGSLLINLGRYHSAAVYLEKTLDIYTRILGPDHPRLEPVYSNLAIIALESRRFGEAENWTRKSLGILEPFKSARQAEIAENHSFLGRIFLDQGKGSEAKEAFAFALELMEGQEGQAVREKALIFNNLGEALLMEGERARAEAYFKDSQVLLETQLGRDHPLVLEPILYRCEAALAGGQFAQMMELAREGQTRYLRHIRQTSSTDIYGQSKFINLLRHEASALHLAARRQTPLDAEKLQLAAGRMEESIKELEALRNTYQGRVNKAITASEVHELVEDALSIYRDLYESTGEPLWIEKAFSAMEKSRASALRESLNQREAMKFSGVPGALLELEESIRGGIDAYNLKKEEESKGSRDSAMLAYYQEKLFALSRKNDSLQEVFRSDYPDYFGLRYNQETASLGEVESWIQDQAGDAVLISYFFGEKSLFAIALNNGRKSFLQIPVTAISGDLEGLRQVLSDPFRRNADPMDDFATYTQHAYRLFEILVKPFWESNHPPESLILLQDGLLAKVPFEALLTTQVTAVNGDYRDLPYLVHACNIQYMYASTLWVGDSPYGNSGSPYLGFAPSYPEAPEQMASLGTFRNELIPLKGSQEEVLNAAKLFGGTSYLKEEATKNSFFTSVADAKILHLAMHAILNDEDPLYSGLAFADTFVYAYEIYSRTIPAALAVLSACNTGAGQVQTGEGILSLAHAFRYAGCPGIITSLWRAEDQSTRRIMSEFFQKIKAGDRKDIALRNAKVAYLADADKAKAHPFYWAAFTSLGDPASVPSGGFPWKWIGLAIIALVLVGFLVRKSISNG